MKYGSCFSGIDAASVAWHPLGWEAQWFSEIEPFPSAVLAHRFPNTPNLGDITLIHNEETFQESTIDLLVGGSPCQSFSVAGLRKGLADPRGNLMLTFLSVAERKKPRWIIWENVPGVLSSNGGRDFATFLTALAELGYGFAYRILDAQYFGVAQRRRRVFVVGYLGDWRPAAAVLFERHGLSGHPAPRREKREGVAASTQGSFGISRPIEGETSGSLMARDYKGIGNQDLESGRGLVVATLGHTQSNGLGISQTETANTLAAVSSANQAVMQPAHAFKVRGGCEGGGKGYLGQDEAAFTISTGQDQMIAQPLPFNTTQITSPTNGNNPKHGDPCHTLASTDHPPAVVQPLAVDCYNQTVNERTSQTIGSSASDVNHYGAVLNQMAIRRLTPKECERLQGFPDNHTMIPWRGKPADQCPDGPRYKACGNSMAVPVMRWIGERINLIENFLNNKENEQPH